jgi:hypothetical protein
MQGGAIMTQPPQEPVFACNKDAIPQENRVEYEAADDYAL